MNAPFCANESALDREMNAQYRADQRKERIEARAKELMLEGGECDPTDADNLAEALTEAGKLFWIQLSKARRACDAIHLANLISSEARRYWAEMALSIAERQIDQEPTPCGCVAGCRRREGKH